MFYLFFLLCPLTNHTHTPSHFLVHSLCPSRVTPSLPPSVTLSFSFPCARLGNTVTGPKNTSAPAKRGEDKQRCELLEHEISSPLQLSASTSVKHFMKPILLSLSWSLSTLLGITRYSLLFHLLYLYLSHTRGCNLSPAPDVSI